MELKRIVNIMPDDKFLDYYIEMSEQYIPNRSTYLFVEKYDEFKYVKSNHPNIMKVPLGNILKHDVEKLFKGVDVVVFHSLNVDLASLIDRLPGKIRKIWIFWGFDGYITQKKNKYISTLTSRLRFPNTVRGYLKYIKNRWYTDQTISKSGRIHTKMIKKMDYCATWAKNDYMMAKSIHPDIKFFYFNYYTEELMNFPTPRMINMELSTIMLGNSGSEYNNHEAALDYLKDIGFKGKIYCPLSYNGSIYYRKNIEEIGRRFFGENFIPLKDFLPLDEYQKIINSCDVVWMNHKRQQAAGNLVAAFYTGKVVVLDQDHPLLDTFKEWGLSVYHRDILVTKDVKLEELVENQKVKSFLKKEHNKAYFSFLINQL
ncbi:TDP-N-acetylfucosamine:lipid II N-acetylfucosaminyltransferase [Sphingobacterium lumbrici]|uniref:TDP-N-acetylfucosamine:lipid II N-acetylfucosaminyltransferase n=1 Tax=Sphingobacterium lumbrici TaxID=2559600 RepID=UPI00112C95E6|nr:TDP-N-acetylfucosamine:lipid II N-acetylfucosaminyltransferase [Sphingobacterium lumbrici]